jgi:hypothetical protein
VTVGGLRAALLAAIASGWLAPAFAQTAPTPSAPPPKWGASVDLEGKVGNKRNLGETDLFVPLWQDGTSMAFGNIKMRMDDSTSTEGNFGLGFRHMLESGWNLGAYGYFDRRKATYGSYFNQVTTGVEALSMNWDFRANLYTPEGRRSHQVDSLNSATLDGTTVVFRGGEERSLRGFDGEIGWRVPVYAANDDKQVRVYGGGYRFYGEGVNPVQGPRGRVEYTIDEIPELWAGARLTLGAELQHDGPRGTTGFASARVRIPLQIFGAGRATASLTPMERRMTDPVIRDIDIVSRAGSFGPPETVTQTASGSAITVLNSSTTTGAALPGAVAGAAAGSTVILSGTFATTAATVVGDKTLMGGGSVAVVSPSGRTAVLTTPNATINGTAVGTAALQLQANGVVTGMNVTNSYSGGGGSAVRINDNATGVSLTNSVITAFQSGNNVAVGLSVGANTSGTVSGNTVTATGSGTATTMQAFNASAGTTTLTIAGNSFSASGGTTNNIVTVGGTTTLLSGSTGNVRGNGACVGTPASGFIGFTDGTTCP